MAKNGKYKIRKDDNTFEEVSGMLVGEWWGIHKREDKMFVLTHIPSGLRVWSSRKKTTLQLLLQEPEFFDQPDVESLAWRNKIAKTIQRFCDKNTDLFAKPKKKIGWE